MIIFAAAFAIGCLLIALVCMRLDPRVTLAAVLLFALYLGLDDLLTGLPRAVPMLDPITGRWNWSGKLYSLLLSAGVIAFLGLSAKATGLVLPRRDRLKTSLIALCVLTLLSCGLGFLFWPPFPTLETIAFQALMPGPAEELAYRGIAPAILLGLHRGNAVPDKTPWAVVLATAAAFGLWHGLGYSNGAISFDALSASFPFIGGIAYGWLRFHSGSLLFPIAAHALGNNAFYLSSVISAGGEAV